MGRLLGGRKSGRERRRRHATIEVSRLETREHMTVSAALSSVLVNPGVLRPTTSGRAETVTISGVVATNRTENPGGFYFVTDEYRAYEPRGPVALTPIATKYGFHLFSYSFTIRFPTQRSTRTPDGRHFDLFVGATDRDGTAGKTVEILVPKTYPPPANMPYPNPNPYLRHKTKPHK